MCVSSWLRARGDRHNAHSSLRALHKAVRSTASSRLLLVSFLSFLIALNSACFSPLLFLLSRLLLRLSLHCTRLCIRLCTALVLRLALGARPQHYSNGMELNAIK